MAIFDFSRRRENRASSRSVCGRRSAIVDPDVTRTLPATVVACSGFDVLSHALESYTRDPVHAAQAAHRRRPRGRCRRARTRTATSRVRSAAHSRRAHRARGQRPARRRGARADDVRRDAGRHRFRQRGLPRSARDVVRRLGARARLPRRRGIRRKKRWCRTGCRSSSTRPRSRVSSVANPARHLEAAAFLGADVRDASAADAGEALARRIIELDAAPPRCRTASAGAVTAATTSSALTEGAFPQQRLLANAPRAIGRAELHELFEGALSYW